MGINDYRIPASALLRAFDAAKIDTVTTVPDFVQLSLHVGLERGHEGIQYLRCATEEQAVTTAAGLIIGGRRPLTIVQNQGFYACINAVRGAGLDAGLPIVLMIGQFGREDENLGSSSQSSGRRVVRLLEPLLETLEIPYLRLERPGDEAGIPETYAAARREMRPAAIIVGARTGWN